MRDLPRVSILLAVLVAMAPAAHGQAPLPPLPPLSSLEPLPPGAAEAPAYEQFPPGPPQGYFDLDAWMGANVGPTIPRDDWSWQLLPDGIIYKAYLANPKESRMGTTVLWETDEGQWWDSTLGGRIGMLRYGTCDAAWAQGWQLDVEGSAFVRLDPEQDLDLQATDYRIGVPLTYGYGRHRLKFGYYHLCAHVGDELLEADPALSHLNFVRDVFSLGYSYYYTDNLRLFAETGYAFYADVSKEWEFLFGFDYAPALPTGLRGAPFVAAFGHLREELNYSGNFVLQAGWAWRGDNSSHLLRTGLHYYNGLSDQFSFFTQFEQQIGIGLWYDY